MLKTRESKQKLLYRTVLFYSFCKIILSVFEIFLKNMMKKTMQITSDKIEPKGAAIPIGKRFCGYKIVAISEIGIRASTTEAIL